MSSLIKKKPASPETPDIAQGEKRKVKALDDSDSDALNDDTEMTETPAENTEGKRGLTYQIFKNKGTTPYRKKEFRNPRVKHRMKYRKALISRKGQVCNLLIFTSGRVQVRTHHPELHKYGGEQSGIRAGVVKSIKFK